MNGESPPEEAPTQRTRDLTASSGNSDVESTLRRLDVGAMIATTPRPVDWVVDNFVTAGGLTMLAGLPGEGKSLLAQAVALAAVSPDGGVAAGLTIKPCRVLIIDAENGPNEIHRRVHLLGVDPDRAGMLAIAEADGFHLQRDLHDLAALMQDVTPSLVILDGFRSLWPEGDENASEEVTPVLANVRNLGRRLGSAMILIHHSPRRGGTYRGSGAIAASCECVFILERAEGDKDQQRRRLRCVKSRPAPEPAPRWIRLATQEDLAKGLRPIREAEPFTGPTRESTPARALVVPAISEFLTRTGPATRAEVAHGIDHASNNGTFRRAFDDMVEQGVVVGTGDGRFEVASHNGNAAGRVKGELASQPARHGEVTDGSQPGYGQR